MANEIHLLPAGERSKRYRQLAAELEAMIAKLGDAPHLAEMKTVYETLAKEWMALAEQAERNAAVPSAKEGPEGLIAAYKPLPEEGR